jgi:RNA polymerase sigma-70 factor (ECF subfamily)
VTLTDQPREPLTLDESQLMADVSAGSVSAFGALYDRYCSRAYRVAFSISRDDDRAHDAVQEAFLSIWNSRASYRPQRGTAAAWLLTVVRHRAIDLERRNGRHATHRATDDQLQELQAAEASDDVCEQAIHRDTADRVHAKLALLPDAQREVITLAFYGQLTHTEIAAQLGLPTGTVKGRMRLGLQKLQARHQAA